MFELDPILLLDSYKLDHRRQYPEGTTRVYSNFTPRGSRVDGVDEVVFFGLQQFLTDMQEMFQERFFDRPIDAIRKKYAHRVDNYLGPNDVGTDHIADLHDLGFLPLEIRAVPEGTKIPLRTPGFTVENTVDDFFWLTNYLETLKSASLWLPMTSATTADRYRKLLDRYALLTNPEMAEFVNWQGHDFSMRGMENVYAAVTSGMGHLLSFDGSDTISTVDLIEYFYPNPDGAVSVVGSVPATEHSVQCAGGNGEGDELATYRRLITEIYPSGIVSIVSDTWDLWNVITNILPQLKSEIMSRDGKLVIRPDSGDPVKIICGDPDAPVDSPAYKGVIELLFDIFGGTKTSTGYYQLDPHIGVIYGDAITYERAQAICEGLELKGFASTNMVFGIGSFTYQYVTRDTYNFAMKATWVCINGEGKAIFKKPVTDNGQKNSATGRLAVIDGKVIDNATPEEEAKSLLQPVWKDGEFLQKYGFEEIRERVRNSA